MTYMEDYEGAINDLSIAIDKVDENKPEYFFYRALNLAMIGNYKDAIIDFSIAIKIKNDYAEVFLQRGKCYFLNDDVKSAFVDF